MKNIRLILHYKTLAPLSHIGESISTETFLREHPILQPGGGLENVFAYSGNAVRWQWRDVRPDRFREALDVFETLYRLGFSKDSILTGHYHPKTLMDVGPGRWRAEESRAVPLRIQQPQLWTMCHFVAQKETPP